MKKKFYFENVDADHAYTEEYFRELMVADGMEEMTVLEAIKSKDKDYIYCKAIGECGEAKNCGKDCEDYEPRNGKNGCCRHRGMMMEHGDEVILRVKKHEMQN